MKKIINNLMIVIMLVMILPINVFAANDTKIAMHYDSATNKYLIYPNRACTYELSSDDITPPVSINQIYDTPSDVIEVSSTNIGGSARYLWIDGNVDPYDLQAFIPNAITNAQINQIDNTMERIAIKPVKDGDRIITLTKAENYNDYKYILVKVEKGTPHDQLVARTEGLDPKLKITDPYTGINKMLAFKESYDLLLPAVSDSNWKKVPSNGVIEEPLDTKTGDIYVVWLMADDNGNSVLDMQIMYCLRKDEKIINVVEKLPQTGLSYVIDGLLLANAITLPIIFFKRKKLVNN